jgi:hypothetical protein
MFMNTFLVLIAIILLNTILFGQVVKVTRSTSTALVDSTLLVQYFKDGSPQRRVFIDNEN